MTHRITLVEGEIEVCDTCVNSLGYPVNWEQAPCQNRNELKALPHLRATASDPRISRISDGGFDLATGRPLSTPGTDE